MAYRKNLGASNYISADVPQEEVAPHSLRSAPRALDASGYTLPQYDGHDLMYALNAMFPYLGQYGQTFEQWSNDPDRYDTLGPSRDHWYLMGRGQINNRLAFVQESNTDVSNAYSSISKFSRDMLSGMVISSQAVVDELVSWPEQQVPPPVITEIITYLQEWISVGKQSHSYLLEAEKLLKVQLKIANDTLSEAQKFADVLHESYESEIGALRTRVRELEDEVIALMDEIVRLHELLEEKGSTWDKLLAALKAVGGGIAVGGISALLIYAGLGLAALFLLRKS